MRLVPGLHKLPPWPSLHGASHVDIFDPKPELTKWHGKKLPLELETERNTQRS